MPEGAFGGSAGASGSGGVSSSQAGTSQAYEEEAVRDHPTMTTMDNFRVIEGRLGHIDTRMMEVRDYVDDMALGIFGMSDQFDGFQNDMRRMQAEQQRFYLWNVNRMSEIMAGHLSHEQWNGPLYGHVPNIGVQQGVTFMDPPQ